MKSKNAIMIGLGFALLTGVFVYVNAVTDRRSTLPLEGAIVVEVESGLSPIRSSSGSSSDSNSAGTVKLQETVVLKYADSNGEVLRTMSLSEANPNVDPGMSNTNPNVDPGTSNTVQGTSSVSAARGQTSNRSALRESIVIADTPVGGAAELDRQSTYTGSLPGDGRSGTAGVLPGANDLANLATGPLPGEGEDGTYGPLPGEGAGSSFIGPLPGEGEPELDGPLPGTGNPE